MQKKLIGLFAFAIFVLVVGLQIDSYACHGGPPPHTDCGGGGGSTAVNFTVDDTNCGDPILDDNICSDGKGTYVNGTDHVGAGIRPDGDFHVHLRTHKNPNKQRQLVMDFDICVEFDYDCTDPFTLNDGTVLIPDPPLPLYQGWVNIYTHGVNLREMEVGSEGSKAFSLVTVVFDTEVGEGDGRVFFGDPTQPCDDSTPITVTRNSDTEWKIKAVEGSIACVGRTSGNNGFVPIGNFIMPFQMTVVTQ